MDLIGALQSFLRVAETGSFSAVAKERGVTQPAISRQISALEEHLGTRLVHRSTQAVSLTEDGRELVGLAQELIDSAEALKRFSKHRRDRPVGRVRVAMPIPVGIYLSSLVARLLGRYEEISIEVVLRDTAGDLVEEGLDLAIHIGAIDDSSLIARRIGTTTAFVVASPAYLKGRKVPRHPRDLEQHDCIVHHRWGSDEQWWFGEDGVGKDPPVDLSVSVRGRFSANNAEAVHRAALNGHGIALLSHLLVTKDIENGRLRRLLEEYPCRRYPLYIVYPSRRALPPRTRVVIDFLTEVLSEDPVMSART
jgi:DNA-binding transcriptional LysR family regulator